MDFVPVVDIPPDPRVPTQTRIQTRMDFQITRTQIVDIQSRLHWDIDPDDDV
jgi:hypothetical protein